MTIHATAFVDAGARIDPTADIGPYCTVGPNVTLGPEVRLISHVVVTGHTTVHARCIIHPFAVIGGAPQDKKFAGEEGRLIIGEDTVLRESVTVNIGTQGGLLETRVGRGCLLMACSHVAHDCVVGNEVVLANSVALAGHVTVGNHVTIGGLSAVHQFCRIGMHAFIGGGAMIVQDVPPYCVAQGDRAMLAGLNIVGLKRAGWSPTRLRLLHRAYRTIFVDRDTQAQGLAHVEATLAAEDDAVRLLCQFVRDSQRGICHARRGASAHEG